MSARIPDQKTSIKQLLSIMVKQDASDVYITSGMPPSYRINSKVVPLKQTPLSAVQTEQLANSVMSEKQRAEFSETMEMNLAIAYEGMGRFRVNIFRQRGDVGMVIRKITTDVPTIEQLGLPDIFKDIIMSKRGLVLMVGATSSGKSTSLAAMIDHRNRNAAGHIITIEDPIEFVHQHRKSVVTQREVGTDTLDFKYALKNTLRQAPDLILVGEIRDRDTMEHALTFAETGHVCVATLHANNSNQALERIRNFFPEEMHTQVQLNLAMNMKAILSQRLVRTVDGGRTVAIETLINTARVADQIGNWDIIGIKDTMEAGANYGMNTFDQALLKLWKDGRITEDEALRNADAANDLRLKMKMNRLEASDDEASPIDQLTGSDSGLSI
ncbi:PilT/PilU family type 4a pilus ATPase [Ghiorsea bivora]|uniref:PilT/PilU family type 4a pilus ATPase n=1 Tax=Ghiorsea bivora TaxID=1485545 RepID=UPI000570F08C|nr:PilT/PilU family type 4a pilus ATPase [Ghiorsea bivora]